LKFEISDGLSKLQNEDESGPQLLSRFGALARAALS